MVEEFAATLGVTAASCYALGIGFIPSVPFANGRNDDGWWCFAERNESGCVVGLTLRRDGYQKKPMYPESKHGLVYPIRPGYKAGSKAYVPGRHNWVRTMDAGICCPICGKPDGCLLSAENPADPKAVMCIRVKKGNTPNAPKSTDAGGWLHVRKPEGELHSGGALPDSPHPVIIVEGASDAAAALDLGFVAVGRPSNLAGMGLLRELVRGRKCVIIGENDKKFNEKTQRMEQPGADGVEATFETLKSVCPSLVKVFPPDDCKDFRIWSHTYALTADAVLAYIAEHGTSTSDSRLLEDTAPLALAEKWLRETQTVDGIPILRLLNKQWFQFDGTRYVEVDETSRIRGRMYDWLDNRTYSVVRSDGGTDVQPFIPTKAVITNIIDALSRSCPLAVEPPCWLDGRTTPDPKALIGFANGVLDINRIAKGEEAPLIAATPHYFTLHALPYEYDATAACPTWVSFLASVFPGPDGYHKRALLQEWFGLMLVPDTSYQKMMLMIGPPGSGKSTTMDVMRLMLGQDQIAFTSFDSLGEKYGLSNLVGKLAAVFPDARIGRYADTAAALMSILAISGADSVSVRRMALPTLSNVRLPCRITITTNELPELPDTASALPRRLLALEYTESFAANPDITLSERLAAEIPGILNWSLLGLERLRKQGEFTIPQSSTRIVTDLRHVTSPVVQFVHECCFVNSNAVTPELMLYDCWRNWCREHSLTAGMRLKFASRLMMSIPTVKTAHDVVNGEKVMRYVGLGLTPSASNKYLGA